MREKHFKHFKLAINLNREMKAGNIFSHLCFVYHYVARNVDMLEKNSTKQAYIKFVDYNNSAYFHIKSYDDKKSRKNQ